MTQATGYPRSVDDAIARMLDAADHDVSILDDILRRAGLRWEHLGCWTNTTRTRTCQQCGTKRSTLERRGEVRP